MTTPLPSRFDLGWTAWLLIIAVLLVILAAMAMYVR